MEYINDNKFFYRSVPGRDNCFTDVVPQPPLPILSQEIVIEDFLLTENSLYLSLSWRFPEATFGSITGAELIVLYFDAKASSTVPEEVALIDEEIIVVRIDIPVWHCVSVYLSYLVMLGFQWGACVYVFAAG